MSPESFYPTTTPSDNHLSFVEAAAQRLSKERTEATEAFFAAVRAGTIVLDNLALTSDLL